MANDLRSFNVGIDEWARKINLTPVTIVKRVGFDLFGRIVRKTPVDTGRARASWNISVNEADRSVTEEVTTTVASGISLSKGQKRSAIKRAITTHQTKNMTALVVRPGDSIVISNNLPYITALEDGHSQQAPAGMVALSIEEVNLKMNALMQAGVKDAGL